MNQNVNGNMKFLWKEINKENGVRENCSRIKYETVSMALDEVKVRRISKKYFEDLYNIDT